MWSPGGEPSGSRIASSSVSVARTRTKPVGRVRAQLSGGRLVLADYVLRLKNLDVEDRRRTVEIQPSIAATSESDRKSEPVPPIPQLTAVRFGDGVMKPRGGRSGDG